MCIAFVLGALPLYAAPGQMGFFGGINEGVRLPKTTESLLAKVQKKGSTNTTATAYKEIIFIDGEPVEFSGELTVRAGVIPDGSELGSYRVIYDVKPTASTSQTASISRSITFNVNYRVSGNQTVLDYTVASWSETLTTPGGAYVLDPRLSRYDISILEDKTPGVKYYKGDVSGAAVYTGGAGTVTVLTSGSVYGYESAWSNTETHRLDVSVIQPGWQVQLQVRPSVSVNKTLQYADNEPSLISFPGNYKEVMSNKPGLRYTLFTLPTHLADIPREGGTAIATYNAFEQLIAPDLSFLKGNPAEADIKKLFAMNILSGEPKQYQPSQKITRAQYVTMLTKAAKLPLEPTPKPAKKNTITFVFPDVTSERPDYQYIMAAYKSGLAVGRSNGHFYADYAIMRQEAIVLLVRALGLGNLGLDPTPATVFTDDARIADWAKKEICAAYKIGLIKPDANGAINPTTEISKAEAAALVNLFIDYMRDGLGTDYTEHIVNYAN